MGSIHRCSAKKWLAVPSCFVPAWGYDDGNGPQLEQQQRPRRDLVNAYGDAWVATNGSVGTIAPALAPGPAGLGVRPRGTIKRYGVLHPCDDICNGTDTDFGLRKSVIDKVLDDCAAVCGARNARSLGIPE